MTELKKSICILPELLSANISDLILAKVKTKFEGKTTKEDGYITRIYDDLKIIDNVISSSATNEIIFQVKFTADILKPHLGMILDAKVFIVESRAICTSYDNKMNIIIPSSKLQGFKFDKVKSCFESDSRSIKVGDIIKVEITNFKYEKQFNCIGNLIN